MEENKKEFITWIKRHTKQLILAGISVTTIIGIIIGLKNKEAIKELWEILKNSLSNTRKNLPASITIVQTTPPAVEEIIPTRMYTSPRTPFDVSQHIRNLSNGRHHSIEKAAEAATLKIDLLPHQTLVDSYTKCAA